MNTCICCGYPIQDNRQVCKQCEDRFLNNFSTADYIAGHARGYLEGSRECYAAICKAVRHNQLLLQIVNEAYIQFKSSDSDVET